MPHFTRDEWINMDPAEYARHAVPQGFDPRVTCACGEKSALYEMFPSCRDCGEYVCLTCEAPGTRQEREERMDTVLCVKCVPQTCDGCKRAMTAGELEAVFVRTGDPIPSAGEERFFCVSCLFDEDERPYDAEDALDDAADWAFDTREDV